MRPLAVLGWKLPDDGEVESWSRGLAAPVALYLVASLTVMTLRDVFSAAS